MDGGTLDIAAKVSADHADLKMRLADLSGLAERADNGSAPGCVATGLSDLVNAIREHFHREEIWMDMVGVVTAKHAGEHDRLTRELDAQLQAVVDGERDVRLVLEDIAAALCQHEREIDNRALRASVRGDVS